MANSVVSRREQEKFKSLQEEFNKTKEEFDRAVNIESLKTARNTGNAISSPFWCSMSDLAIQS
jgi:hypothetical protein